MRDIGVNRVKFSDLVEERYFTLPLFQREYSWNEENWEEFIQSITSFIDNKKIISKSKSKEQELKKAYQDFSKNKKLKKELAVWDEAVGDGVNNE